MQRYISNELSHFAGRGLETSDQYKILVKILKSGWVTHPPHNPNISGNLKITNASFAENKMYSPEVVCFCDIPISDVAVHANKYSKFGLSFSKDFLVKQGAAPIWYLPVSGIPGTKRPIVLDIDPAMGKRINAEHEDVDLGKYFEKMVRSSRDLLDENLRDAPGPGVDREAMELARFWDFCIFSFIKFFDHSTDDIDEKNFYMEREWRILGNVRFKITDVHTVFIPPEFSSDFRRDIPDYVGQVMFL